MNKMTFSAVLGAAFLLGSLSGITGCSSGGDLGLPGQGDDGTGNGDPGTGNGGGGGGTTNPAASCDKGATYMGFANTALVAGRVEAVIGADRSRVKPYSALQGEYTRVLGNTPASLAGAAATFGQPAKNWYVEPQASAVEVYTAYAVAFDGCLTYTATDAAYANPPDATSAATQCAAMARKFWSATATPDQINACVQFATTGTASITDARRRWAHTCASVMTASGFLAY